MAGLKGSKTEANLKAAFAGESQANRRYLYFAQKADVEGYEARAFAGGAALLERSRPCLIVFEYAEYVTEASGVDHNAVFRELLPHGYRIYVSGGVDDLTPSAVGPNYAPGLGGDIEARLNDPVRCAHIAVAKP